MDRYDEVYAIVRNTFLLAIAPVILLFLHSLVTDPALPQLMRVFGDWLKKKMLSDLGRSVGNSSSSSSGDVGVGNEGRRYRYGGAGRFVGDGRHSFGGRSP